MNKKIIISIGAVLITILLFSFRSSPNKEVKSSSVSNQTSSVSTEPQEENNSSLVNQETMPADKIEVVHFHATRQCFSCITVGKYTLQTIKDKFSEEYHEPVKYADILAKSPDLRPANPVWLPLKDMFCNQEVMFDYSLDELILLCTSLNFRDKEICRAGTIC